MRRGNRAANLSNSPVLRRLYPSAVVFRRKIAGRIFSMNPNSFSCFFIFMHYTLDGKVKNWHKLLDRIQGGAYNFND
jgi:hypothetical protein